MNQTSAKCGIPSESVRTRFGISPARRCACIEHVIAEHGVSERFACRALGQHRSTQRKAPTTPDDEGRLTADIVALAIQYGRYGYRRITAMLRPWAGR